MTSVDFERETSNDEVDLGGEAYVALMAYPGRPMSTHFFWQERSMVERMLEVGGDVVVFWRREEIIRIRCGGVRGYGVGWS